jgi:hypothetical protein
MRKWENMDFILRTGLTFFTVALVGNVCDIEYQLLYYVLNRFGSPMTDVSEATK